MTKIKIKSTKQKIKDGTPSERHVPICMNMKLVARHEELSAQLAKPVVGSPSLSGDGKGAIAAEIRELEEQMAADTIDFVIAALPRPDFTALIAAHPPRQGNQADRANGFNEDTLFDALIRACTVAPDDLDEEDWTLLLVGVDGQKPKLSSAQYERLANTAWAVNRRDVDVPFSPAASLLRQTSAAE